MQTEPEGLGVPTFMDIKDYSLVSKKVLEFIVGLAQWSPIFWATGISFGKDNFSTGWDGGMTGGGWVMIQEYYIFVYFISIIIVSAPPHIIALDPRGWGPLV